MAKFVARYRNFVVRLDVTEGRPLDTPEHREHLLKRLGELIVRTIKSQVRFSSE